MKTTKIFTIVIAAMVLALTTQCKSTSGTRSTQDIVKERKAINNMSKSQLNAKASKDARKEAKSLRKQGWTVAPGALPMEKQLDRSYLMQYEYDQNLFPKYIMAEAMSTGGNYDAAKRQALELAIENLAGQIEREITALIENSVANQQMDRGQAVSVTRTVTESKNLIATNIGRVIPIVEMYRPTKNNGREVLVRLAYNSDMAMEAAKKAVQQDLEKRGEKLSAEVDKIFNTRFGLN